MYFIFRFFLIFYILQNLKNLNINITILPSLHSSTCLPLPVSCIFFQDSLHCLYIFTLKKCHFCIKLTIIWISLKIWNNLKGYSMLAYKQVHHFSSFSVNILETCIHTGLLNSSAQIIFFFTSFLEYIVPCRRVGPIRAGLGTGLHCSVSTVWLFCNLFNQFCIHGHPFWIFCCNHVAG